MLYAGLWKRFCAAVADAVMLMAGFVVIALLGRYLTVMFGVDEELMAICTLVLFMVLYLAYFPLMESSFRQATIGKMAMGLKVTDQNGNRITFGRALVRHLCKVLFNMFFYLGSIMMVFTEKKQGLYDIIAGTLVVRDNETTHFQDLFTRNPVSKNNVKLFYAGFGKRFCAIGIDFVILIITGSMLDFLVETTMPSMGMEEETILRVGRLCSIIMYWFYFSLMESSSKQATIGKMVMKLKVTNLDGGRIGFGRATGRFFAKVLSVIPLFTGFFAMLLTPQKQCVHDLLTGCLVLEKQPL